MRDSPPNLPHTEPVVTDDLPECRRPRGILIEEWRAFRARAVARITETHRRLLAARAAHSGRPSKRAAAELARAAKAHRLAQRDLLIVDLLYATGARVGDILRVRIETFDWFPNGTLAFVIPAKSAGRTTADIAAGTPKKRRELDAIVPAHVGARVRAWLTEASPHGALPTSGHLLDVSPDAVERAIDTIAREAGVQRYLPGGRERASHKYLFHAHSIREFSERRALDAGAPLQIVARTRGHSEAVVRRHYFKTGLDEARLVADALPW